MLVALNSIVLRQTSDSPFTHYQGSNLIEMTEEGIKNNNFIQGYRDGVILVKVNPNGFYTGVVELISGDKLIGVFEPRQKGENPRQSVYVNRAPALKVPAKTAHVVCYRHDVLAENNEHETDAEWEVVALNGYAFETDKDVPMQPQIMMHNHFGSDGGTSTGWTAEEFEKKLKESFLYWNNKGMLAPRGMYV